MKKLFLLALLAILFVSCSDDDNDDVSIIGVWENLAIDPYPIPGDSSYFLYNYLVIKESELVFYDYLIKDNKKVNQFVSYKYSYEIKNDSLYLFVESHPELKMSYKFQLDKRYFYLFKENRGREYDIYQKIPALPEFEAYYP